MLDEYETYHGVILRQIVLARQKPVSISISDTAGRINVYLIDQKIGVFVKHSAKRMSPWPFTFTPQHFDELTQLQRKVAKAFVGFVCGFDGVAIIGLEELRTIVDCRNSLPEGLRIKREPRKLYSLTGSLGSLPRKVPRGVEALYSA